MNVLLPVFALILHSSAEGSIVGETVARKTQFPFFVQMALDIEVNKTLNITVTCGATLILPKWIISAGHCFKVEPLKILETTTIMGANSKFHENADVNRIKRFIVHENYSIRHVPRRNGTFMSQGACNDIAVAKLQRRYVMYQYVKLAYLPPPHVKGCRTACRIGTIVGIGKTNANTPSGSPLDRHVLYTVVQPKTKDELLEKLPYTSPNKFYTETKWMGEHPLEGNSGAPFVCYANGKVVVYGIMSAEYQSPSEYHTSIAEYEEVTKHIAFLVDAIPSVRPQVVDFCEYWEPTIFAKASKTAIKSIYTFAIVILLLMGLK